MVGVIDAKNDKASAVTFAAAEGMASTATTAPISQTQPLKLPAGDADVYFYFRADSPKDPGIRAGLAADELLTFRAGSCQRAEQGFYRGYLGRITARPDQVVKIFINGEPGKFAGCGFALVGKD
jgi:hypothetical protein